MTMELKSSRTVQVAIHICTNSNPQKHTQRIDV